MNSSGADHHASQDASEAWDNLAGSLASALKALPEGGWLILSMRGSPDREVPNYFVQFYNAGDEGFRAEAVSNFFLAEPDDLRALDHERLIELGWIAPNPEATRSTNNVNYYREWPVLAQRTEAIELAITTLRGVFGVRSPKQLQYKAADEDKRTLVFPELPVDPEPSAEH